MESEIPLKLPVIDFSNLDLNGSSPQWDAVRSQVYKALVEFGCFEVLFDRVPLELHDATFAALEELFDLPLQTKQQNVSQIPLHGYLGPQTLPLYYEGFGITDASDIDKVDNFTNIMWPQGNPSFSKTIQLMISEILSVLDQITRKMVLESLGVEKYIEEHMNSTYYLFRMTKYKAPETKKKQGSTPHTDKKIPMPHTDKNIVSILYQNHVEGLKIQTKDGNWISYKPSPNSFIVLVGESFHVWTNGWLHPPKHCVMMSGNEVRYSVLMFSVPKGGHMVKAPAELVDEKHPPLFKPFDYLEFLKFYFSGGLKDECTLKAYCGV